MWDSDFLLLGENLAVVIILPYVGHPPSVWVLPILRLPTTYPSRGSFFKSLVVEDLLQLVLVFFIDRCSVNSGNSGVPMRGGELTPYIKSD